jgi:hypothetical protein
MNHAPASASGRRPQVSVHPQEQEVEHAAAYEQRQEQLQGGQCQGVTPGKRFVSLDLVFCVISFSLTSMSVSTGLKLPVVEKSLVRTDNQRPLEGSVTAPASVEYSNSNSGAAQEYANAAAVAGFEDIAPLVGAARPGRVWRPFTRVSCPTGALSAYYARSKCSARSRATLWDSSRRDE